MKIDLVILVCDKKSDCIKEQIYLKDKSLLMFQQLWELKPDDPTSNNYPVETLQQKLYLQSLCDRTLDFEHCDYFLEKYVSIPAREPDVFAQTWLSVIVAILCVFIALVLVSWTELALF